MKKIIIIIMLFLSIWLVGCFNDDPSIPEEIYYNVEFVTGTDQEIKSYKVKKNEFVHNPDVELIKEGYDFMGWTLDGKPFIFDTTINSDIVLIASWNKQPELIPEIAFDVPSVLMRVDEQYRFKLKIKNIPSESDIEMIIQDNTIIAVSNNVITGLSVGKTTLVAKYQDVEAILNIEILEKALSVNDAEYWIKLVNNPDSLIMNSDEIANFNKNVYSDYSLTKVYDLKTLSSDVSKSYIKTMIEKYNRMNDYRVFNREDKQITIAEKNMILANRALDEITDGAVYGVVCNFTSVRSFPTTYYASSKEYDKFQETGLSIGEGVLVYHYSADKKWCFVQAANYNGWVETSDIATCSYEDFLKFYSPEKYVIVLSERELYNGLIYRLGDKIPYSEKLNSSYKIILPERLDDGSLSVQELEVQKENLNDGYLSFTYRNIYTEAFKLLNTPYCWGDYDVKGRDCSSTLNAIYKCFGFDMPRNTSNQRKIPGFSENVSGLTTEKLVQYQNCTMIFTSSHVMLYIGCDLEGTPYLLHNSGGCKLQKAQSYGLNNIISILKIY